MTTSLTKETNNSKKLSEKRTSILTCSRRSAHLNVSLPSVLYNSISLSHPVYWLLIGNDRPPAISMNRLKSHWCFLYFFLSLFESPLSCILIISFSLSLSLSLLLSLSIYLSIFHSLSISIYLSSFLRKLELANGGLLLDNKNESIKIRTDSH